MNRNEITIAVRSQTARWRFAVTQLQHSPQSYTHILVAEAYMLVVVVVAVADVADSVAAVVCTPELV